MISCVENKNRKCTGHFLLPGHYPIMTFPLTLKHNKMKCGIQNTDKTPIPKMISHLSSSLWPIFTTFTTV